MATVSPVSAQDAQPEEVSDSPTISSVDFYSRPLANGTYCKSEIVTIIFEFSGTVVVTGGPQLVLDVGGVEKVAVSGDGDTKPQFMLNVGGTQRTATYPKSRTTLNVIDFEYTIVVGDVDDNGVSINANSLQLNGVAVDLTHNAVPDNANFKFSAPGGL